MLRAVTTSVLVSGGVAKEIRDVGVGSEINTMDNLS